MKCTLPTWDASHPGLLLRWPGMGLLLLLIPALLAQAEVGMVTPEHLLTPVLWRGATNEVRFDGQWPEAETRLWLSVPLKSGGGWVACQPGQPLRFDVALSDQADLGLCVGRIFWGTNQPPSAWIRFYVDDMNPRPASPLVNSPAVGTLPTSGSVVSRFIENEAIAYEVEIPGGRRWTAEVISRRMGAPGDPVLMLEDLDGQTLASSHAIPGWSVDARLDVEWAASKRCRLKVYESRFRGSATFPFYLRVGALPPIGVETRAVQEDPEQVGSWGDRWVRRQEDEGSVMVRRRVSRLTELEEQEPNNSQGVAQRVGRGSAVLGRLDAKHDQDWFRVALRKGDKLALQAVARSLQVNGDPWVGVFDSRGQRLAATPLTDREDPLLVHEAREDGDVWLQVREATGKWGVDCLYRLELSEPQAFRLRATTDEIGLDWTKEWTAEITVKLDRMGWDKPVRFQWAEPFPLVKIENDLLEAGKKEVVLKLRWMGEGTEWEPGAVWSKGPLLRRVKLYAVGVGEGSGKAIVRHGYRSGVGVGVHLYPIPAGWDEWLWISSPLQSVSVVKDGEQMGKGKSGAK